MFFGIIPARVSVGLMIFTGVLVSYTMRVNLSVNIVDMVPVVSNSTQENETATLGWSAYERASVLGAYYWGYCVSNIVAGPISERFGPRKVVLITHLASGVLTLASPAAAKHSYLAMVITRAVLGLVAGFVFPALQGLIAYWAVPFEKGKFLSAMVCGTIGTVVAWSTAGVVIAEFGWEWGFNVFGIFAIAWCILWWFLIYNTPEQHPRISMKEKQYIYDGTAGTYNDIKPISPYGRILTSIPAWAVFILLFGNGWGTYFIQNAAPSFIANVLNYKIASTGFLSSLTYLARTSAAFFFGLIGDFILKRNLMSLNLLRKSFCLVSHVIPGFLLLAITFTDNPITAFVLMVVSFGLNGSVALTGVANPHDLSPNFVGTVYGMGNALSTTAGFITPLVVAYFTKDNEDSYDIVCLTETYLFPGMFDREIFDDRYLVFRCDRDYEARNMQAGGGALVAVRRELDVVSCDPTAEPPNFVDAEVAYVTINTNQQTGPKKIRIYCGYFPHGTTQTSFEAWRPVFYIGSGIYISTAFIFMIFGSTEIQGFNEIKSSGDVEKSKAQAAL